MANANAEVVVAGHIALDIIPTLGEHQRQIADIVSPGKLAVVGPAVTATGGATSNTGTTLHRLGIGTRLVGKVGNDAFGRTILDLLDTRGPGLAEGMVVAEGEDTSYTIVISPPGVDRGFMHCPGANDTFTADDVDYDQMDGIRLFHYGYPPLMRRMYFEEGAELETMYRRVKEKDITTGLDMAQPDPKGESGQVNWRALLERTLPHVDLFLPSWDETLFMLDREHYERLQEKAGGADLICVADATLFDQVAASLLELGVAIVVLKLGDQGLYIRTTDSRGRLAAMGACVPEDPEPWLGRELLAPCFKVNVVGATGSGDCTIAGFLAAFLRGMTIEQTVTSAVAVGACNCEAADATSGVPTWDKVQARVEAGWDRLEVTLPLTGWTWDARAGLWIGPNDTGAD